MIVKNATIFFNVHSAMWLAHLNESPPYVNDDSTHVRGVLCTLKEFNGISINYRRRKIEKLSTIIWPI